MAPIIPLLRKDGRSHFFFAFLRSEQTDRLKQQDQQHDWSHKLNHDDIQRFALEFELTLGNFVDDDLRLNNPADQDAGQECNQRHKDIVAEIVHNIKNLSDGAVGQCQFEVQCIVAQADNDAGNDCINGDNHGSLFSAQMECIHDTGNDSFHDRNRGGNCGKGNDQEENQSYNSTDSAHCRKNLRKGDKHQAGACGHALNTCEGEHSRNNHQTCQQCDAGIKNFNLVDGEHQIGFLACIGAIGYHDTHCYAD